MAGGTWNPDNRYNSERNEWEPDGDDGPTQWNIFYDHYKIHPAYPQELGVIPSIGSRPFNHLTYNYMGKHFYKRL